MSGHVVASNVLGLGVGVVDNVEIQESEEVSTFASSLCTCSFKSKSGRTQHRRSWMSRLPSTANSHLRRRRYGNTTAGRRALQFVRIIFNNAPIHFYPSDFHMMADHGTSSPVLRVELRRSEAPFLRLWSATATLRRLELLETARHFFCCENFFIILFCFWCIVLYSIICISSVYQFF